MAYCRVHQVITFNIILLKIFFLIVWVHRRGETKMKKNGIIESLMDIHNHISKWKRLNMDKLEKKNTFLKFDSRLWFCVFMVLQDLNFNYGGNESVSVMGQLFVFDVFAEIWTGFCYQCAIIKEINANNINDSMKRWILINTSIRMSLIIVSIMLSICTYTKMKFNLWSVLIFSIIASLIGDGLQVCFLIKKNCWEN